MVTHNALVKEIMEIVNGFESLEKSDFIEDVLFSLTMETLDRILNEIAKPKTKVE
jgi:hypothetical protein